MRLNLTREFYRPKNKGAVCVKPKGSDLEVWIWDMERDGRIVPRAMAFAGKGAKPLWDYRFTNAAQREAEIKRTIERRRSWAEMVKKRRVEPSKPHTLEPGDVLVSSWGYDQTNIDYYEVIERRGGCTVVIRKLNSMREETGWCTAREVPAFGPDRFAKGSEPMVKRASADNIVRIASYACAAPWDGRKRNSSSYA